ncbi:tRNA (cytidine(34)-2'-O)-methyltransferase [Aurantimonas sp. C2-6-R+9]|uniref:tRNA (cytidine(34)-2'-O)-methyltransferase n=1 Tax=unclassified Aurantimonas TaxID=2638230 RepID=UPI002E196907|nr:MULTISPECIES: tRNA (cytidine(34)-2'-O)-methyltransferase [unclassified Aurantimonas]MEC5292910.1 tRNA (cytidine(34)-2'-O)-methyltransferase [Aurantimonas sp. C2-3-R2]MEC5383132.1 tRNA (cytidine(34)-2'-O)-methyltransferase [Aurantimonas sp. C2-6-R+9]MEC5414031.1 tRNA (cytidine(34)-2'-O)-methyltransferase [Aurantimonas sp. C2-4-R8]
MTQDRDNHEPDRTAAPTGAGPISLALYQPDIAGNTGTILRLGACLCLTVDIIEPAGFVLSDRALKRAGMDYLAMSRLVRHVDFAAFEAARRAAGRRLVLFTTKASTRYTDFAFRAGDILLFGRESAGVPDGVHALADAAVTIPMDGGGRSLNLAVAAGMAAGEALRQVKWGGSAR